MGYTVKTLSDFGINDFGDKDLEVIKVAAKDDWNGFCVIMVTTDNKYVVKLYANNIGAGLAYVSTYKEALKSFNSKVKALKLRDKILKTVYNKEFTENV